MTYNLLCTDIDGTLLNKDRRLSSLTISEIKRISPTVPVILISSRMPKAMRHLQKDLCILDKPLIAYNGGLILDGETVLEDTFIPVDLVHNIYLEIVNTSIHLSLYYNDNWYVPEMDYWAKREVNNTKVSPFVQSVPMTIKQWQKENKGAHKIMAMGDANEIDTLYKSLEANLGHSLALYRSKDTYIEIAHTAISKETAINTLLEKIYPEYSLKNIIAFGDNYNDIAMLKSVGMGVAVANAKQEVLTIANDHTATNKEDGVALSIQKYF